MSVELNKTVAEASLDNLHDIMVPDAVGLFPLAPGWYMVALLGLALLFYVVVRRYAQYKKRRYKREALREISTYSSKSRETALALLTLAKRVGIAAYGREKIAPLSGESWWDFMESHSRVKMSRELRGTIATLLYDDSAQSSVSDFSAIKSLTTLWIKTHKVSEHV